MVYDDNIDLKCCRNVRPPVVTSLPRISAKGNFRSSGLKKLLHIKPERCIENILSPGSLKRIKGTVIYDILTENLKQVCDNVNKINTTWRWKALLMLPYHSEDVKVFMRTCKVRKPHLLKLFCFIFETLFPSGFLGEKNSTVLIEFITKIVFLSNPPMCYPMLNFLNSDILRATRKKTFVAAIGVNYNLKLLRSKLMDELAHFCTWFSMTCAMQFLELVFPSTKRKQFSFYSKRGFNFWKKIEIKKFKHDYSLTKTLPTTHRGSVCNVRIIARTSNLRPICPFDKRADWGYTSCLQLLNSALDFFTTNNGINKIVGVNRTIKDVRTYLSQHRTQFPHQKLYYIKADVTKCFASLNHVLLREILDIVVADRECYAVSCQSSLDSGRTFKMCAAGRTVGEAKSELNKKIKKNERIIGSSAWKVDYLKNVVDTIMVIIDDLKFRIDGKKGKIFSMGKGVPQGCILSSRLTHLYLSSFDTFKFSDLNSNSKMFRYADDYLFILSTREEAMKVLDRLQEPANPYSLFFRKEKTQTSFNSILFKKQSSLIQWCGVTLHTRRNVVLPKKCYSKCMTYATEDMKYIKPRDRIILRRKLKKFDRKWEARYIRGKKR